MRITKIEFENFRNFKDHGEIKCSTDGKVTIIYGKNGDGKTTMHQLFQWVLYGEVKFNKTATDKLYNKEFIKKDCAINSIFDVKGCIDFEHDKKLYSVTRSYKFKKTSVDTVVKIKEDFVLSYQDENYSWRRISNPKEQIERMLPSGLSNYFFFDGEGMIADLSVKGRESAKKLKTSLYSMFGLVVLDSALNHIGNTELKTTVLGSLFLNKAGQASDKEIIKFTNIVEHLQSEIEKYEAEREEIERGFAQFDDQISRICEQIGGHKTQEEIEESREQFIKNRDASLMDAKRHKEEFGNAIYGMFPRLLISRAVKQGRERINLRVENDKLPPGVSREIFEHLISEENNECICGQRLGEKEKKHLQYFLDLLPPKSFASLYQNFVSKAEEWGKHYEKDRINAIILSYSSSIDSASTWDDRIREIDDAKGENNEIQRLYSERRLFEDQRDDLRKQLDDIISKIATCRSHLRLAMNRLSILRQNCKVTEKIERKIKIMQSVRNHFENRLKNESCDYSKKLQDNIQSLLDVMLVSKRKVTVSPEFAVCVMDSHYDESKSEGQFAVVSFAYIGGILKMLKGEEKILVREYPLVLDGPFSKLDVQHRQNVVKELIDFAPQVILFSKDDLHNVFDKEKIGYVWTISSNDEKNVSEIKEGYVEGYFNGNNN